MEQASYARRVFILGMDGAGNFLQRLTRSEIARLARQHEVVTLDAMTELPTISAECWGSMLHGVTPDKHGYPTSAPAPRDCRSTRRIRPFAGLRASGTRSGR